MIDRDALPYRPCAGVILVNAHGQVFVGQRLDSTLEAWQLPQGGIDPGEDPLDAAYRELWEETGVLRDHVDLVAAPEVELQYDLPDDLLGKVWKGKWRGQRQRWFLFRLTAGDDAIDIATAEPEFRAWRWLDPRELPHVIVPFKRALYVDLLRIFAEPLGLDGNGTG
ncbi:RNA pyrophosphohydrolase [Sphingomonas sp.]|jgi:putative (di)nucleoside polyphosphate hydrolase|uniref:RNA pyrophosphohydrolase n=1 Tax=Sphingomonas sp. TaxID=28214 RepID=UPI00307DC316